MRKGGREGGGINNSTPESGCVDVPRWSGSGGGGGERGPSLQHQQGILNRSVALNSSLLSQPVQPQAQPARPLAQPASGCLCLQLPDSICTFLPAGLAAPRAVRSGCRVT